MAGVRRDGRRAQRRAGGRPRRHGLTLGDYQVLVFLSEADGRAMRMCDLAARLQLSPERPDPPPRRARPEPARRAPAVRDRPPGDARRAHAAAAPRRSSEAAPTHVASVRARIFDQLDRGDIAAMERVFTAIHAGPARPRRRSAMTTLPAGFGCHVANVGIKDDTRRLRRHRRRRRRCAAAGVFTRSRFAGPSVTISREHLRDGRARAIVVVSKNANVANGPAGLGRRRELSSRRSPTASGAAATDVLIASTGVIGRRYPLDRILAGVGGDARARPTGPTPTAPPAAIMTTDTVPKVAEAPSATGRRRVVGIAKGVGMIEPDMATMIAVLLTDAEVEPAELDPPLPAGRRAHVQLREHRHRHVDERHRGGAGQRRRRAGRPRRARDRARRRRRVADQADRPRRRRRREAHRGRRRRRPRPGAGEAGRQGDRQLAARQDGRARRRPELGPGGDGRSASARTTPTSTRSGSSSASATARCTRVRSRRRRARRAAGVPAPATRCGSTSASAPATPSARCGAATSPPATSASTPTTRPDEFANRSVRTVRSGRKGDCLASQEETVHGCSKVRTHRRRRRGGGRAGGRSGRDRARQPAASGAAHRLRGGARTRRRPAFGTFRAIVKARRADHYRLTFAASRATSPSRTSTSRS